MFAPTVMKKKKVNINLIQNVRFRQKFVSTCRFPMCIQRAIRLVCIVKIFLVFGLVTNGLKVNFVAKETTNPSKPFTEL